MKRALEVLRKEPTEGWRCHFQAWSRKEKLVPGVEKKKWETLEKPSLFLHSSATCQGNHFSLWKPPLQESSTVTHQPHHPTWEGQGGQRKDQGSCSLCEELILWTLPLPMVPVTWAGECHPLGRAGIRHAGESTLFSVSRTELDSQLLSHWQPCLQLYSQQRHHVGTPSGSLSSLLNTPHSSTHLYLFFSCVSRYSYKHEKC